MINKRAIELEQTRLRFPLFAKAVQSRLDMTPFHIKYFRVLNMFAHGKIKKLIVTVPPQHGKSEGSTRLLPAYCLGLNPDLKIAIASYSDTFAKKFNRDIQRIIDSPIYGEIFPETQLNGKNVVTVIASPLRNSSEFEIVNKRGSLKAVGRGGSLTGNQVDVMIMDDLYSNAMEGNSPTVREAVWDWYTSVVKTRLHNDSRELIVFTRWHEDDLIGRIENKERVIELESLEDIESNFDGWYKLNFPAIKVGNPTNIDPREDGEALWSSRHNLKLLTEKRALDSHAFECMYQGQPASKEGYLYGNEFATYTTLPECVRKGNYTDTADTGEDRLCSICYQVGLDDKVYVTDILYTPDPMEITEPLMAEMLKETDTRIAFIESNNGGRGFARSVGRLTPNVRIEWFHQSQNKEARILSNAATVLKSVAFPVDWAKRWPQFYYDVVNYKRLFRANRYHDAPDVLTGILERGVNLNSDHSQIYNYSVEAFTMRMFNIYSMDIGFKARTAIVQLGFGGDCNISVRELCYKQGMLHDDYIEEIAKVIYLHAKYLTAIKSAIRPGQLDKLLQYHIIPYIIIDCARVDLIEELDRHFNYETISGQKIKIEKAKFIPSRKGEKKDLSIDKVRKFKQLVDPASKYYLNEISNYRYKDTGIEDEKIPDGHDDALDAALYGMRHILEDVFSIAPTTLNFDNTYKQLFENIKQIPV